MPDKVRCFISFDFDHDEDLRNLLDGQAKNTDSPFEIANWSLKEPFTGDWKKKVRERMSRTQQVIVICGTHTHTATGVGVEVSIAQDLPRSYFLLKGRSNQTCTKPATAKTSDKIYNWTWENLKKLIHGAR